MVSKKNRRVILETDNFIDFLGEKNVYVGHQKIENGGCTIMIPFLTMKK
jgi:hypothetical protein